MNDMSKLFIMKKGYGGEGVIPKYPPSESPPPPHETLKHVEHVEDMGGNSI
jgi:hypothetical protein